MGVLLAHMHMRMHMYTYDETQVLPAPHAHAHAHVYIRRDAGATCPTCTCACTCMHTTRRRCYLPHNEVGLKALRLLRSAFLQGEIFKVGTSVTSNRDNTVVWAGIHHKTKTDGGAANHGWPD